MMRAAVPLCLILAACPAEVDRTKPGQKAPKPTKVEAKAEPEAKTPPKPTKVEAKAEPEPEAKAEPGEAGDLAVVSEDVPLPLSKLLRKTPPEVQALLGEPTGKGRERESCVRFTPERKWFECKWIWQRYEDKTKTFAAIQVTYEDGKSADVAFEGVPGAGKFDVGQALAKVGLKLPGTPKEMSPQPDTTVWTWFNDQARLVINGDQFRVMLSVREGKWDNSKLDVMLNSALTEEQLGKLKEVRKGKSRPEKARPKEDG